MVHYPTWLPNAFAKVLHDNPSNVGDEGKFRNFCCLMLCGLEKLRGMTDIPDSAEVPTPILMRRASLAWH